MFEFILLKQSRSDFIERLFYLKQWSIYIYYTLFLPNRGQLKLIRWSGIAANPIADSFTDFLQNFTLSISSKPNKIKQNSIFIQINTLSYPISSKPTKIKYFSHFQTQKSNFHLTKIPPTISKSSLFISTFTDNDFYRKNSKSYTPNIGGIIKLYTKLSRQ